MIRCLLRTVKSLVPERGIVRLSYHYCKAFAAALRYGFPARKLSVIGITGTDGKTTTVSMAAHILHKAGVASGMLSTASFSINGEVEWNETQKTSPSPFVVQKFLKRLVNAGCTHAVLEYSSHGLVQHRTAFTWPTVAAITNIAEEHLDYHKTMEQYQKDKRVLFEMLRGKGTKVLNREDRTFGDYSKVKSERSYAYGDSKQVTSGEPACSADRGLGSSYSQLSILNSQLVPSGSQSVIQFDSNNYDLVLNICGEFNVHNAACALCCSNAVGVDIETGIQALESFRGAPGRLEAIDGPQDFTVFVDMTVTPQAYTQTLKTLKEQLGDSGQLLVLTGSCGDRMKEKRPVVGKLCSEYADIVVVADEDPYTEDPMQIIEQVWEGIDETKCDACIIQDRLEAIKHLFSKAQAGDIVLLCAKGADTTMWVKEGQIPWNEREIAKELLGARG